MDFLCEMESIQSGAISFAEFHFYGSAKCCDHAFDQPLKKKCKSICISVKRRGRARRKGIEHFRKYLLILKVNSKESHRTKRTDGETSDQTAMRNNESKPKCALVEPFRSLVSVPRIGQICRAQWFIELRSLYDFVCAAFIVAASSFLLVSFIVKCIGSGVARAGCRCFVLISRFSCKRDDYFR